MSLKTAVRLLWGAIILSALTALWLRPEWFTAEQVAAFLSRYPQWIWGGYIALSSLRGLSLLPSTPFVLAGTLLFPTQPLEVLVVSVACILVSSAMIYALSPVWQLERHFKPTVLARISERLNRPSGSAFVFLWSFFPAVPTDAICYVAGTLRLRLLPFLLALGLGELILCSVYVYAGGSLLATVKALLAEAG
jgi:uncharacterized membrane protein YdjX (TVP38/TMEM64 family)